MLKLLPFMLFFPMQILAGVGDVDNRYYVTDDMWATEPYKKFVYLEPGFVFRDNFFATSSCSAQYISPNLILSAGHCINTADELYDEVGEEYFKYCKTAYKITNYKKEKIYVKLVDTLYTGTTETTGDWAVWLVTDPKYYSDTFFDIVVPTKTVDVINAGWGWARIFSDEEISQLQKIYKKVVREVRKTNKNATDSIRDLSDGISERFGSSLEDEQYRLKASQCKILFIDCSDVIAGTKKFKDICNNQKRLKKELYPDILATTCDNWGGNSGGGYISLDGNNLYGTCSYGVDAFKDSRNTDYIVSAKQFFGRIRDLIKTYDSKNSVEDNIAKIPTNLYGSSRTEEQSKTNEENTSTKSLTDIDDLEKELYSMISQEQDVDLSNEQILTFINKLAQYQEAKERKERLENLKQTFEDAKANEQSLANRTLTAASIAATGIGGMELAMGLSEQKADKEAQQDMSAYIASFRCEYGNGKQVKAGPEEIVLPGGNDEKLMSLRTKYMTLATDLKKRKTALGMKPGIESEEILDKTAMNLYDDENTGIESGAYGSLYRAKMLGSEEDQAKLDEEAKKSKNRVIAGATVAGAGIIGGIAGNMAINGTDGKKNLNKIQEARTTENGMSPIPAKRDICTMVCELNDETKKKIHSEKFGCTCTE